MELILTCAIVWLVGKVIFLIWYCAKYGYPRGNKELNDYILVLSNIWFLVWPFWKKVNPNSGDS